MRTENFISDMTYNLARQMTENREEGIKDGFREGVREVLKELALNPHQSYRTHEEFTQVLYNQFIKRIHQEKSNND